MSRKSIGLVITLLLINIVIVGIGFYYIFNLQTQVERLSADSQSGIVNTWHNILLDTIDVNSTYEPIDQFNTSITVNSGEWVLVSFSGNAKIDPSDTLRHALIF